ncbi:MAG: hypothetical protein ACREDK_05785 [Thermoplasmata archaeon]
MLTRPHDDAPSAGAGTTGAVPRSACECPLRIARAVRSFRCAGVPYADGEKMYYAPSAGQTTSRPWARLHASHTMAPGGTPGTEEVRW